ncbi:ABC transporter substrate-binding protein [Gracilimonas sp. Q87]|uniref:ABC transporter substrate-binding protein n=1 Tax=Gracilimonas sp. Q87 TaxID=3384766 RepID=UPI0039845EF4
MKKLILLLLPVLAISSCGKGPETITVRTGSSDLFAANDSTTQQTIADTTEGDDFIQLKVGEIAAIESLDPLFATSNSELRVINLIYDGLVGIGNNGNLYPLMANRWNVNEDSTQFTFHLKTTLKFHDSPAFENGTGRQFTANDVKFVFERMARNDVPAFTGNQFSDIRGFEVLQNELEYVKDSSKRVISEINGIRVQNDSTVTFVLNRPSTDFLNRLAHPMASIYASESVPSGPIQQAAGTGRFRFLQKENNTHLLTVNEDHSSNLPDINRLDIISGINERNLYQEFAGERVDVLVELGAATLLTVADSTGELLSSYYNNYELHQVPVSSDYPLYYNSKSGQANKVNEVLDNLNQNSVLISNSLGSLSMTKADTTGTLQSDNTSMGITHTTHPFYRFMLNNLAPQVNESGYSFAMSASYAFNDQITFTTKPYPGTEQVLVWDAPIYLLSHSNIQGITVRHNPWNLDLSSFSMNGAN